jgi:DNA end-binding protein Ku
MRSMWKGTVSFGLVSIPIHLYAATEGKSISFRQVHAADGGRVQYKRVCSIDGQEVPYVEVAKGYELDDGSMVVLTDSDLADVPVSSSKSIDVLEFLPLEAIDPISYDRSYFMEPQKAAIKPYVLLRDALGKSGRVALVKVTLRQRESLALLRVYADVLVLSTLLWPEEVRTPDFGFLDDPPQVRDQELAMAGSLIDSMTEDVFEPDEYQDSYQQALRELIDAKIAGKDTTKPGPDRKGEAQVVDLMSALQASISATRKPRAAKSPARSRSTSGSSGAAASGGRKTAGKPTEERKTAKPRKTDGSEAAAKSTTRSGQSGRGRSTGSAKSAAQKPATRKTPVRRPKSA